MAKITDPKDPVPTNLTGPRERSFWIDKAGDIVQIEPRVSFHHAKLNNGELVPLEEFYKRFEPYVDQVKGPSFTLAELQKHDADIDFEEEE